MSSEGVDLEVADVGGGSYVPTFLFGCFMWLCHVMSCRVLSSTSRKGRKCAVCVLVGNLVLSVKTLVPPGPFKRMSAHNGSLMWMFRTKVA